MKDHTKREEKKTIGDMIAELEADLNAYREADKKLSIFRLLLNAAKEPEKKIIIKGWLERECGFTRKEVNKIVK